MVRRVKAAWLSLLLASVSCLFCGAAAAADKRGQEPDPTSEPDDDTFDHGRQFALRAALVAGYRVVARYSDSPYCRDPDRSIAREEEQKVCGHAAPLALDLGLSYGLFSSLEPFLWARFGLSAEQETNTDPLLILGAGVRLYTMSDSAFKIYIEPAVGVELEGEAGDPDWSDVSSRYKTDLVLHLAAGPQLDLAKNVGIYADAGITAGIVRAFHAGMELKLGVQVRLP